MKTGFEEVFSAIKSGKELRQIRYSLLDPDLFDVVFVTPTYFEATKIQSFFRFNQEHTVSLMLEVLNQYIIRKEDRDYLFGLKAPAGLISSTFKIIMFSSFPRDAQALSSRVDLYRKNGSIVDSITELLVCEGGFADSEIKGMTLDQIAQSVAIVERNLITNQKLESEVKISGTPYVPVEHKNTILAKYRQNGISEVPSGIILTDYTKVDAFEQIKHEKKQDLTKQRKTINFEEENRKLEKALGPELARDIIRDDLDPYNTIFAKGR